MQQTSDYNYKIIFIGEQYDIGFYIDKKCTDDQKYNLLKNKWMPDENYNFPVSQTRNLKFQRNWLSEFHWLAYSQKFDGAFCHFCVLIFLP